MALTLFTGQESARIKPRGNHLVFYGCGLCCSHLFSGGAAPHATLRENECEKGDSERRGMEWNEEKSRRITTLLCHWHSSRMSANITAPLLPRLKSKYSFGGLRHCRGCAEQSGLFIIIPGEKLEKE